MSIHLSMIPLVLTLLMGSIPLLLTLSFRRRIRVVPTQDPTPPDGLATLIIPCKGLDPGFRENISAFLQQDYPSIHLIFVVAHAEDPAHSTLKKLLQDTTVDTQLIVAGVNNRRAQKLTNQLAALREAPHDTEYLVFLDSDIRPDAGFVRRLIVPLSNPQVGATTGFRWYHPPRPTLGSILRSTWNAGALPFLVDPKRNFAWGGAMAIRYDTFRRARIAQRWEYAVSDDFPFTLGVRELGLQLHFVPTCIAVSYEASTLADTIEFTNRQSVISRVYFPPLWWGAAIAHSASNLLLFYGVVSLLIWVTNGGQTSAIGTLCLLLAPLEIANAALLLKPIQNLLPQLNEELSRLRFHYMFAAPIASLLSLINTLYSLGTRRICWRGICYELRSTTDTVVITP